MPQISVVIPAYNRAELIGETIDSVLAQTFQDFEIIVVDDGSTDDTATVIASYGSLVQYLYQENAGQAAARNAGIRAAQGQHIALLDSDDLWLPPKLEKQVSCLLSADQCAWVYCDVERFGGRGERLAGRRNRPSHPGGGWIARQLLLEGFVASPTPVVHRSVFADVGLFQESKLIRNREDWDMWLRIAARYPAAYVPEVLARYRIHSASATQAESPWTVHQSILAVIERAVAFAPEVYGPVRERALAMQHLKTGNCLAAQGQLPGARRLYWQAIRLWPATLPVYPRLLATLLGKRFVMSWVCRHREQLGLLVDSH